jgi:hypothetical protein
LSSAAVSRLVAGFRHHSRSAIPTC